ncbi:Uncharacterised protein [Mycobacteroides abscessus subsp. abscessus]|nr:Uncharacterised protein [Mycobacteroides abscessus subsp. abscessus]
MLMLGRQSVLKERMGHHRHNRNRYKQRCKQGKYYGKSKRKEQFPNRAFNQSKREEYRNGDNGRRQDRHKHFFCCRNNQFPS